jgi:hypothetical protein
LQQGIERDIKNACPTISGKIIVSDSSGMPAKIRKNRGDASLDSAIAGFYDAALDPSLWQPALAAEAHILDLQAIHYLWRTVDGPLTFGAIGGPAPPLEEQQEALAGNSDERTQRMPKYSGTIAHRDVCRARLFYSLRIR